MIYVSSATREFSEEALTELLEQSRDRNKRQNITGMLLYAGGNFFQILEGAKADVRDIYASIAKDERNTGNIVYEERDAPDRVFPGWWMGFHHVSGRKNIEVEGYTDFINNELLPEQFAQRSDAVIDLLYSFKQSNQRF